MKVELAKGWGCEIVKCESVRALNECRLKGWSVRVANGNLLTEKRLIVAEGFRVAG